MRRRQIGLRARNKLAQLSPNSRGILANVARLPASSNFSSLAFFSLFLSLFLPPSLPLFFSVFHSPPRYHLLLLSLLLDEYVGLEKSRERLVESDSNRVRNGAAVETETIRACPASSSGKRVARNTRERLYLTIFVRASWGLIFSS